MAELLVNMPLSYKWEYLPRPATLGQGQEVVCPVAFNPPPLVGVGD